MQERFGRDLFAQALYNVLTGVIMKEQDAQLLLSVAVLKYVMIDKLLSYHSVRGAAAC